MTRRIDLSRRPAENRPSPLLGLIATLWAVLLISGIVWLIVWLWTGIVQMVR